MPSIDDPAGAWAASGAMWLTGHPGGPPLAPAAAVVPTLEAVVASLGRASLAAGAAPVVVDVAELLAGRAALLGLGRRGRTSANGSCRLLRAADGWVAVNLAREADIELVPALVGGDAGAAPWDALGAAAERMPAAALVEQATLLGLPVSRLGERAPDPGVRPPDAPADRSGVGPGGEPSGRAARLGGTSPGAGEAVGVPGAWADRSGVGPGGEPSGRDGSDGGASPGAGGDGRRAGGGAPGGVPWMPAGVGVRRVGEARVGRGGRGLLVVDLSAMWAGPLCARLLGLAGLRVVKVESTRRPDGARGGDPAFFRWLHGGHESVALDLASTAGRVALARLVAAADVVIEASRPRALAQLGIDAEAVVAARPGTTWVSITGYGRTGEGAGRVAFGDDAAVAGGLVARDAEGRPVFCGDAIADPITGLHAAAAALASVAAGGGHLLDVAMADAVAATCATPWRAVPARPGDAGGEPTGWVVDTASGVTPVARPRRPALAGPPAHPLGADTAAVLGALGVTC
jgi:hypothetical protein